MSDQDRIAEIKKRLEDSSISIDCITDGHVGIGEAWISFPYNNTKRSVPGIRRKSGNVTINIHHKENGDGDYYRNIKEAEFLVHAKSDVEFLLKEIEGLKDKLRHAKANER